MTEHFLQASYATVVRAALVIVKCQLETVVHISVELNVLIVPLSMAQMWKFKVIAPKSYSFLVFFSFSKKLSIVVMRNVCPSVCLSLVEITMVFGCTMTDWPIDLKLHLNIVEWVKRSVYEKLQATRAKVAPVNLIYGSHFSATEATYYIKCHKIWGIL